MWTLIVVVLLSTGKADVVMQVDGFDSEYDCQVSRDNLRDFGKTNNIITCTRAREI